MDKRAAAFLFYGGVVFALVAVLVAGTAVRVVYADITLADWPDIRPLVIERAQTEPAAVVDAFVTAINASPATNQQKLDILNSVISTLELDLADLTLTPEQLRKAEFIRKWMRQNTGNTEQQIDNFIDAIAWPVE